MSTLSPELIADSFVTLASLFGLILLGQALRGERPRPTITRRFLFALQVVGVIMAARLLQWFTGWEWAARLTFAAASLVPLAALLVTEALMRRHAPVLFKIWVAGGAVIFTLAAIIVSNDHEQPALLSLASFQALTFLALAILVLRRDRQALSAAENTTINRLALSLILILPLAVTDFRTDMWDMPVRLGGVAILVLCWLALTLRRGVASQSDIVAAMAGQALGAVAVAGSVSALAELDARTTLQVMAVVLSALLLGVVYTQVRLIRREDTRGQLLAVLAEARTMDHAGFLRVLQTRALTSGALVLEGDALADFDASFRDYIAQHPLVSFQDLGSMHPPELAEQFEWLFRKFDASHAMLVSQAPFRLMALQVPALVQSAQLEQELRAAQHIAQLLAEREARDA